jgi:hypothetical protein
MMTGIARSDAPTFASPFPRMNSVAGSPGRETRKEGR